jgi:WD40 repeat protein
MAVVYRARQPGLGRLVALKWLAPAGPSGPDAARFLREVAAVARMHHPNIVQVYETGECQGRPFLVLELVTGGTLIRTLRGHVRAVTAVRFSPHGRRLFRGSQDQTDRVWHAESGQPQITMTEPDEVTVIAVDATGQAIAMGGPAGTFSVRWARP